MANSASHAGLPFPVKGARYTVAVPYLDADGDPTDPTTPDTEISKDGASFADCTEEVTTITGSNGAGYITLTGAEMDCSLAFLAAKVASGPKATLAILNPRVLPVVDSGTAAGGAAGSITLRNGGLYSASSDWQLLGMIVKTTGGTGGGGTGGANNQARVITAYDAGTRVATVSPDWETAPDSTTTYELLAPDGAHLYQILAYIESRIPDALVGGRMDANVGAISTDVTAANNLEAMLDGTGGVTITAGITGNITGNLSGSVGSVTAGVTVTTNNDKTGYSLSTTPPTAAAIADAVWDEAIADHLTGGTTGAALNGAGSAGDPWGTSVPGAYSAGTAGYILGTNLNATVSSRLASASYTAPLDAAGTRSAVGLASANLDTQLDALPTAAENATAVLTTQMTESYATDGTAPTLAQAQFMIWSFLAERSIASVTLTAKKLDGSTTAMTFTLNDATTPTAITRAT